MDSMKIAHTCETEAEAWEWLEFKMEESGETCVDNYRFAYQGDVTAMEKYLRQKQDGCCGSMDALIVVNGRAAMIGCNFGH